MDHKGPLRSRTWQLRTTGFTWVVRGEFSHRKNLKRPKTEAIPEMEVMIRVLNLMMLPALRNLEKKIWNSSQTLRLMLLYLALPNRCNGFKCWMQWASTSSTFQPQVAPTSWE